MFRFRSNSGFSLAELLFALLILGQIATFTIPKVLHAQSAAQKKAVFKETISAINSAAYQGMLLKEIDLGLDGCSDTEYNIGQYLKKHINAIKICSKANDEGCWTHPSPSSSHQNQDGFVLANGATLAGLSDCTSGERKEFMLDWNGEKGPNVEGMDQIRLRVCCAKGCNGSSQRPGTVEVHPGNRPISHALFEEIFLGK